MGFRTREHAEERLTLLKSGRINGVHDPQREDMIKEIEEQLRKKNTLDMNWSHEKNWTKTTLHAVEGDGEGAIVYTSKKHPTLTVEMHPMDDEFEEDKENGYEARHYNAWYIFPARNGKGIPSSPEILSESGGYTRKDAIEELLKQVKEIDEE